MRILTSLILFTISNIVFSNEGMKISFKYIFEILQEKAEIKANYARSIDCPYQISKQLAKMILVDLSPSKSNR